MCVQLGTNTFQEDMMQNLECKIKIRKINLFFLSTSIQVFVSFDSFFFDSLEPTD
jgi:hypothetical protein